jgi:LysM repeat protein
MKRRTRLICIGCAVVGTFPIAAQAASASTNEPRPVSVHESSPAPRLVRVVVRASTKPPRVHAPVERVTVEPGDTLSAIGARTSRTWEQLAGYNHIPNPDLIYADQVLIIPPAGYVSGAASTPTPVVESSSAAPDTPAPAAAPAPAAQSSAPQPSGAQPSGIWACIASHESGGNPSTNTGNGYYGMYQDTQSSWVAGGGLAYAPRADQASAAAQTIVNQRIQAQQGWSAWPVTSAMCGA